MPWANPSLKPDEEMIGLLLGQIKGYLFVKYIFESLVKHRLRVVSNALHRLH